MLLSCNCSIPVSAPPNIPKQSDKGRKPKQTQGFRPFSCPVRSIVFPLNPTVTDGNIDGNTPTVMALTDAEIRTAKVPSSCIHGADFTCVTGLHICQ
ncbi:hypothetical protein AGMMS49960_21770 [Betaproteobacteria bacterium]|nr:hypothetical protein AGMMS49960_21770 [Betaproteobacteria bacterium]